MPSFEDYKSRIASETPEPHFKPGYTGYLPGYGPHRVFQVGNVYEKMTHDLIMAHPVAGGRLRKILGGSEWDTKKVEEEFYVWGHESNTKNLRRRCDTVPGYTGYIPKVKNHCGRGFGQATKSGIAEFYKENITCLRQRESLVQCPQEVPEGYTVCVEISRTN